MKKEKKRLLQSQLQDLQSCYRLETDSIIFDSCRKLMLQNEELTHTEKEQINITITLLTRILNIDQYLIQRLSPVPDPYYVFTQIIRTKIPPEKESQQQTVQLLASCFYKMALKKETKSQSLDLYFEKYLQIVQFMPVIVRFYQKTKQWGIKLKQTQDLTTSKKELEQLSQEIAQCNQSRLELLRWRTNLASLILSIVFNKKKIERSVIVSLMKRYSKLKGEKMCIAVEVIVTAFCFIISSLLKQKNQSFTFFQIELQKILHKQVLQTSLSLIIQKQLNQCEKYTSKNIQGRSSKFQPTTINNFSGKNNAQTKVTLVKQKKMSNFHHEHQQQINKQISVIQKDKIVRSLIKRKDTEQGLFKSVDLFLTARQSIHSKSMANFSTRLKITINPTQTQSTSVHLTSQRIGWFTQNVNETKQLSQSKKNRLPNRISSSSIGSKRLQLKKRKQIYLQIKEKDKRNLGISNIQLTNQMYALSDIGFQRCKIAFSEICLGYGKKTKDKDEENIKFKGAAEDSDFGTMHLTFLSIFNQQKAILSMKIRKFGKQNYVVSCSANSTFCHYSTILSFHIGVGGSERISYQTSVEDIRSAVQNSTIYYEALQERVERKIGMIELQAMQEIFREKAGYELSQQQLTNILRSVDLIASEFFWYYTKSSYINGSKLQKRNQIQSEDLSAFAVSLGKFKSDYDSCLNEIVQVQNMPSLIQTCKYLSHGRLVVHRQFRSIKGKLFLQVISIAQSVYGSFKRISKKPYFEQTILERKLYNLDKNRIVKRGLTKINLSDLLSYDDVFIFFMKNIVQNFIQIKYVQTILDKLMIVNQEENKQYLQEQTIIPYSIFTLEIVTNNSEIEESFHIQPLLHQSINHLRGLILMYCQVYHIEPKLNIHTKTNHTLKIHHQLYTAHQIELKNGVKIVKLYRPYSNSTYNLFLYHQEPAPLTIISTTFHNRVALLSNKQLLGNMIRNDQKQQLIAIDYVMVAKVIIKFEKRYCYACISQCQSIMSWRLDLYDPLTQMQSSTFFHQEVFLQCMTEWGNEQDMWKKCLSSIQINIQKSTVSIVSRELKLFNSYKRMYFNEQKLIGCIQLIQIQEKLSYLIYNFEMCCLSIGEVEQMLFINSRQVFSTTPSTKLKINAYNHLIVRLCKKIICGRLPSTIISIDYFQIQQQHEINGELKE